jgi:NADP-dependent 3-hydroxy acid dehydrogenase YdfG
MKTALITGATSGIGLSTARLLAKNKYNLVLCGRRNEVLEEVKKELSQHTQVHALCFDVRQRESVLKAIDSIPKPFSSIDVLINNAGNAHGLDSFQDANIDDFDAMIDGNVKGLLYVSKAVLGGMLSRNSGHIIHIGSTAAKEVYPKGNVYCASKAAVDAINQGMRIDLNGTGIKVGAVHPGLVETNFSKVRFKNDDERAEGVYKGFQALKPEDSADIIFFVITRNYHVNIADLVVMPTAQANSVTVHKEL